MLYYILNIYPEGKQGGAQARYREQISSPGNITVGRFDERDLLGIDENSPRRLLRGRYKVTLKVTYFGAKIL